MMTRYRYMNTDTLYVYIGKAVPAGAARDQGMPPLEVYQHPVTGELYYRTVENFAERMTEVPDGFSTIVGRAGLMNAGVRTLEREHPALVCCESCRSSELAKNPDLWSRVIMICCSVCGNKRCPKARNHCFKCTGSNEVNQVGEYEVQQ